MTRLNKFLGESGLCSRREADALIAAGRVRVNGSVAGLGVQVGERDRVELDGRLVRAARPEQAVYIAYNKPVGVVCVTDRREPANIIDAVRHPRRVFPVGRLDKPSEGLIFLTSDGDVVNKILRAGNAHEKEYDVRVNRPLDAAFTRRMSAGVPILDTVTRPCKVMQTGRDRFTIVLTQGLNRQIRRMCEHLGYEVTGLRRTRIMHVRLDGLAVGRWRDLTPAELEELRRLVAHSSKTEEASRLDEGDD
jgi:23S rRNA pseudouridine2604 synthase